MIETKLKVQPVAEQHAFKLINFYDKDLDN